MESESSRAPSRERASILELGTRIAAIVLEQEPDAMTYHAYRQSMGRAMIGEDVAAKALTVLGCTVGNDGRVRHDHSNRPEGVAAHL